jgi:hypothetical protein
MECGSYGVVLLIKIVHVAVENLDEELYGHRSIHACICYPQSALEAFEDAFAVSVEL